MHYENLASEQNIHALGIGYIYNYLSREGYTIFEVNTDPNQHFQFLAKGNKGAILVAVRTACHPDLGTIDQITHEQLIKESDRLDATPYFAGLSVTSLNTDDLEIDGATGGREYRISFNGMSVIDRD